MFVCMEAGVKINALFIPTVIVTKTKLPRLGAYPISIAEHNKIVEAIKRYTIQAVTCVGAHAVFTA